MCGSGTDKKMCSLDSEKISRKVAWRVLRIRLERVASSILAFELNGSLVLPIVLVHCLHRPQWVRLWTQ